MSSLYGNAYTVVAGNGQSPIDGPLQVNNFLIQSSATVAYTITSNMCGAIITIPVLTTQGANVVTVTLPNPVQNPGFYCKFVLSGNQLAGSTINIDGGAVLTFHPVQIRNANTLTTSAICRGVSFLVAATAVVGDFAEVISDGFRYKASITSSVAASVGNI